MAIVIFDFDDTIFETYKLNDSFSQKMESIGVPSNVVKNTYEITKKKFNHYTFDNHIDVINKMAEFNITDHKKDKLNDINFSFYKSDETFNILNNLSKTHTLILLTCGDKNFQELKIYNSGLSSCFHEIHIIPNNKENFLMNKNFIGDVYFINDKKSENDVIRKMFPGFKVIDFDIKKEGSLNRLPLIN